MTNPYPLLSEDEINDYGEPFIDVVRRVAAGILAPCKTRSPIFTANPTSRRKRRRPRFSHA
jgi:hypothetical protein